MSKDTETDNTIDNETTNTGSLGSLLQEYREQADLDIESVAQALRLPVSAVEALENENFSELPEPPYVRGYLRSYARLAEADPQDSIDLYEKLRGSDADKNKIPTAIENAHYSPKNPPQELISPFRFKMGLLTLGILGLIILSMIPSVQEKASGIWASFSPEKEETIEATINTTISDNVAGNLPVSEPEPEPAPIPEVATEQEAVETNQSTESETESVDNSLADSSSENSASETAEDASPGESETTSETTASDTEQETTTEESTEPSTEEEPATADSTEATTDSADADEATDEESSPQGDTNLKLVFSDEVWIRINDGEGKRLFEALNPAGTEKELSFNKPMKFRVGNAQGMKLIVDGEEMDISEYINGSIAKFGLE